MVTQMKKTAFDDLVKVIGAIAKKHNKDNDTQILCYRALSLLEELVE